MSLNPISPLVDSVASTVVEAVDAAAAAPLNPVTLALAVAAGLVLGLLVMRAVAELLEVANWCVQAAEKAVGGKIRQRALEGKSKRTLRETITGRATESEVSAQ